MSKIKERSKAAAKLFKLKPGKLEPVDLTKSNFVPQGMTRAYRNNRYVVMVYDSTILPHGIIATKVLVQRNDAAVLVNHWQEMQAIKNEIFGEEVTAIEYYPKESKLINDHNIYWLWIFPDGLIPEYN